ncbi:Asp/Glu/hydantoin racemase [Hypoxylon crocopeplum]|nr:Asp/Glu/hydantoin racemase [Hypoxylon crocopeplum]
MATKLVRGRNTKILVLNPNSSQAMTDGMKTVIDAVDLPYSSEVYTYTGPPEAPSSINDGKDLEQSTEAVLNHIWRAHPDGLDYDGVVVACFSVHPLVADLQSASGAPKSVTGIFEASVLAALSLLGPKDTWGIVTTGKFWEEHLANGVRGFLGSRAEDPNHKFAGVESTNLNASDFHHGVDPAVVRQKLKDATKRLLSKSPVTCIVMGCAGMAGLEEIIRSAAEEEKGEDFAHSKLHVIDGVRAGIMQVEHMIKHQRLLRPKS